MTHDDWLAVWQVASTMFGWRRDDALLAVIDRTWNRERWIRNCEPDLADHALRQLEQRLATGRRLVPADFTTTLRLEHQRAHPDVTERVDVGPLTHEERQAGLRGIALCRWVQAEKHEGRPPSGPAIASKHNDPHLVAEHGRPGDEHRTPGHLLAGDPT